MATLSIEQMVDQTVVCREALKSVEDSRAERRRWGYLVLASGVLLLGLLAAAVLFFHNGQLAEAALSTGAAIADGAALAFIVSRRQESEKNLRYWQTVVRKDCPANIAANI